MDNLKKQDIPPTAANAQKKSATMMDQREEFILVQ